MVDIWLIVLAVGLYFYTIACAFFTAQIAREKGRCGAWGTLGFFLGLVGFVIVCFLPNTKKVEGDTNPIRLAFKKLRSISPVAVWIVLAGVPFVILASIGGTYLTSYLESADQNATVVKIEEEENTEKFLNATTVKGGIKALFSGEQNNFAVTAAGDLYAWGRVDMTALDESGRIYQKAKKICVAGDTYYILNQSGELYAKGDNRNHLIPGQSAETVADFVKVEGKVKDIALSESIGAILKESGNLYVYGVNTYSQLGLEEVAEVIDTENQMADKVQKIQATDHSFYYLTTEGKLYAVGSNAYGQFGLGHRDAQVVPVEIATDCKDFAAGDDFLMLLKKNGTVWTAGNDCYGQLGRKTAEQLAQEISDADKSSENAKDKNEKNKVDTSKAIKGEKFGQVEGLEKVTAIAAGGSCAFALKDDKLYAWGENYLGQLGLAAAESVILPQLTYDGALRVSTNGSATMLCTDEGKLLGAGDRRYQQLGKESGNGFAEIAKVKGA